MHACTGPWLGAKTQSGRITIHNPAKWENTPIPAKRATKNPRFLVEMISQKSQLAQRGRMGGVTP